MSGIFFGHSHPRPCSGKKTLRRCRNDEEADHVILIDGDSENFDNVIILDVPESLPKNAQGASMLRNDKWSFGNVIFIDDDETPDSNHSIGVNNVDFSAGTSSKREPHQAAKNFAADTADAAVKECHFAQDNATPVRLSKCKRTYSGKSFTRNRYGLNTNSESDSSDSDYPDCELVEDSSGEVQELWERAFSRRRKDIPVDRSDTGGHHSTSHVSDKNHHQNIGMEDATPQHKEDSCFFSTRKFASNSDAPSPSRTFDNDLGCSSSFYVVDDGLNCEPGISSSHIEQMDEHPASSNSAFKEQPTKEFNHPASACDKEETPKVETCPTTFVSCVDSSDGKSAPLEDEVTVCKSRSSFETKLKPGRYFTGDDHKNFQEAGTSSVKGREHLESRKSNGHIKETKNLIPKKCPIKRSVPSVLQEEDRDGELHSRNEDLPFVDACMINEREQLKETDEYKRAMEEEWAARQQALLIQAEEAQRERRLRKRIKAENMRLLDMERRQKQRVEEMRSTQKKDEENMNLKETIRTEVRIQLNKLETTCHNMASLLHSLGICVGGWPNPSPQEVQTGYKRALLTFHPDRTQKSDIRQQVEAEEKFKLINRLKAKFPPL